MIESAQVLIAISIWSVYYYWKPVSPRCVIGKLNIGFLLPVNDSSLLD